MFGLLNVGGRAALEHDGGWYDCARLSGDETLADPMAAIARHHELHALAARAGAETADGLLADVALDAPVPVPRQVFGIGLNYNDHAAESGMQLPPAPLTFTKFPSCIAAPNADIPLPGTMVDWEVEIVAVVGEAASHVAVDRAWDVLAGLTLGQDVSDRAVQMTGVPPQFCLGKSFPAFGPIGISDSRPDSTPSVSVGPVGDVKNMGTRSFARSTFRSSSSLLAAARSTLSRTAFARTELAARHPQASTDSAISAATPRVALRRSGVRPTSRSRSAIVVPLIVRLQEGVSGTRERDTSPRWPLAPSRHERRPLRPPSTLGPGGFTSIAARRASVGRARSARNRHCSTPP